MWRIQSAVLLACDLLGCEIFISAAVLVKLTNDSLHLRKLARLLLDTHGCDVVRVGLCVDVDTALILFGGALSDTTAKSSTSQNVGCCCGRQDASSSGPQE